MEDSKSCNNLRTNTPVGHSTFRVNLFTVPDTILAGCLAQLPQHDRPSWCRACRHFNRIGSMRASMHNISLGNAQESRNALHNNIGALLAAYRPRYVSLSGSIHWREQCLSHIESKWNHDAVYEVAIDHGAHVICMLPYKRVFSHLNTLHIDVSSSIFYFPSAAPLLRCVTFTNTIRDRNVLLRLATLVPALTSLDIKVGELDLLDELLPMAPRLHSLTLAVLTNNKPSKTLLKTLDTMVSALTQCHTIRLHGQESVVALFVCRAPVLRHITFRASSLLLGQVQSYPSMVSSSIETICATDHLFSNSSTRYSLIDILITHTRNSYTCFNKLVLSSFIGFVGVVDWARVWKPISNLPPRCMVHLCNKSANADCVEQLVRVVGTKRVCLV